MTWDDIKTIDRRTPSNSKKRKKSRLLSAIDDSVPFPVRLRSPVLETLNSELIQTPCPVYNACIGAKQNKAEQSRTKVWIEWSRRGVQRVRIFYVERKEREGCEKEEYDMYCTSVSNPEAWHGMISIDRIVESKESATREDRTSQDIYIYIYIYDT